MTKRPLPRCQHEDCRKRCTSDETYRGPFVCWRVLDAANLGPDPIGAWEASTGSGPEEASER